jgi:outer membrane protein OmpA-like peptidoglycan-associated protein
MVLRALIPVALVLSFAETAASAQTALGADPPPVPGGATTATAPPAPAPAPPPVSDTTPVAVPGAPTTPTKDELVSNPESLPSAPAAAPAAAKATGAGGASARAMDGEILVDPEWQQRERDLMESSAINGGVGLLHMQHAQGGSPGQFRIGFTSEYFSAGFLCTSSFPCPSPTGSGKITSDTMQHIGGTLSLSAGIFSWLEGYASISAIANSDTANRPELLQTLGDTNLGLKGYARINDWWSAGGAAEMWLINGSGSVGLDGSGTSAKFRALTTADLRNLSKPLPLRFSANVTYSLDNTGDVISDVEAARGAAITRIERYGLGIDRVDHIDFALGGEAFFVEERIRPFIEWNISAPVNRQAYVCNPLNLNGDHCLGNDAVGPSKLTFGSRFYPWKTGFGLTLALDVGTGGVNDFIEEVAPTPPWTLYIGAGWALDTRDKPPVVKVRVDAAAPTPKARIVGIVHEKDAATGVGSAVIRFDNHPDIPLLASEDDGHFTTPGLLPGDYTLSFKAEGFAPDQTCAVKVPEAVEEVRADCALVALPRAGTVVGRVHEVDDKGTTLGAVAGASVILKDAAGKEHTNKAEPDGSFRSTEVAAGKGELTVTADGYISSVETLDVKPRETVTIEVLLHKRGKPQVSVGLKEIFIKQQVQFATDQAVILPQSSGLLGEIADVLRSNPRIHRVEIQGHTDDRGSTDHNQQLSEERATAVKTWLTAHGVDSERLVAKGYGPQRPLVPNVTERNRARNRRVQFIILDQDKAAAGAKAGAASGVGKKTTTGNALHPNPF